MFLRKLTVIMVPLCMLVLLCLLMPMLFSLDWFFGGLLIGLLLGGILGAPFFTFLRCLPDPPVPGSLRWKVHSRPIFSPFPSAQAAAYKHLSLIDGIAPQYD